MLVWDREAIVKQLLRETKLSEMFYGTLSIDEGMAKEIAKAAELRIKVMGIAQLSGALVREIVNQILLEDYKKLEWRNVCTRVGTPVYDAHLSGDLHVHDLEYLGTRGFCQDWVLRYFFYYGLMPDGSGTKASVAGPAKKPEVAILHAVTILGSAHISKGFHMER